MNPRRRTLLGSTALALASSPLLAYAMMQAGSIDDDAPPAPRPSGTPSNAQTPSVQSPALEKISVFLTSHSLMQTSGVSVQTKMFALAFRDWLHFHWTPEDSIGNERRSIRLEERLPASEVNGADLKVLTDRLNKDHLSWWQDDKLKPEHVSEKLAPHRNRVGVIYVAASGYQDSSRLRFLIEYFKQPFVVHFWDLFDGGLEAADDDTTWLLAHASKIFVLTQRMYERLDQYRAKLDYLTFTRERSKCRAKTPTGQGLKIALIGSVTNPAFHPSIHLLMKATRILANTGMPIAISYVGSVEQFGLPLDRFSGRQPAFVDRWAGRFRHELLSTH